jgi:hypothetical protein
MEIKKTITGFLLLALMAISSLSFAQEIMEDVVYLKNGGLIHGLIIEQVPGQNIKIRTADRNIFVLKFNEIAKMTKEAIPNKQFEATKGKKGFKQKGFFSLIENNFCSGTGNGVSNTFIVKNNETSFGFRTVNGYQINKHFALGIGFGFEKFSFAAFMPITLDTRINLLPGKVSPVLNANIGYAAGINGSKGGVLFYPSLGLRVFVTDKTAYFINLGYKWQRMEVSVFSSSQFVDFLKDDVTLEFISFSTGFIF